MELTRKLLDSSALTLADQRQVTVICSTGEPDRMGDVIVQSGIDLAAYRKNPIVLWGHSADVPIAKAVEIDVKNGKLQATVQFPPEGADEDSDWVYNKIKAGIVNATSVGFIPTDYVPLDPKQPWDGFKFLKSELLEFSFVSVPANSGCLIVGRSMFNGVDLPLLPSLAKTAGEHPLAVVEDVPGEVRIPRNILEEAFRLAKTPRAIRQKYLAKSAAPEWKACAVCDLPVIEADAWDGAAAAKRILDAAGFDGDSPDPVKAARGFLIHDAANPVLRSSYKLPFADIVDGELKAIRSGVAAANSRIDQSDAPAAVRDEAKQLADEYGKKTASKLASLPAYDPDGDGDNDAEEALGMISAAQVLLGEAIESLSGSVDEDDVAEGKAGIARKTKSGRRISSANEALLRKAVDHHESATRCIKDVLASNAADDAPDGEGDDDGPVVIVDPQPKALTEAEQRAKRIAEAKALRASVNV